MSNKQTVTISQQLFTSADRTMPGAGIGSYSLADDVRLIFSHGKGSRMWDVDGKEYIDYVGGAGALIAGHSHPTLVKAAVAQIERGNHMFGSLNPAAIALAERLVNDIPCAEKIAYATTGSEATAYAMRLARAFTGREKILKFEGAYHGNHDYAIVSTFPKQAGTYPQGVADSYGQPHGSTASMLVAPYNDLATTRQIVAKDHKSIAAIIVEGVQRIIAAEAEFLHGLRTLCDEFDILLIIDEVVTGFRLGYGGAQAHYQVTPDLATYGKVIGASGPLSCIAGRAEIMDLANPRFKGQEKFTYFNGTLHGNPVAAASTLALLDMLSEDGIYEQLADNCAALCAACQSVLDHYHIPAIVIHTGSLWQILFMPQAPRNHLDMINSDQVAMRKLDTLLLKQGQYVLPGVRRFISICHDQQDIEETVKGLTQACEEFLRL